MTGSREEREKLAGRRKTDDATLRRRKNLCFTGMVKQSVLQFVSSVQTFATFCVYNNSRNEYFIYHEIILTIIHRAHFSDIFIRAYYCR